MKSEIGLARKNTREPNHARLYHYTLKKDLAQTLDRQYCWITGSSNMTRPGLSEQHELNVQLLDFGGDEAKRFFDALWETAVPLTDDPETKKRIIELVERCLRVSDACSAFIEAATVEPHDFKVGFDSCMVSGLVTEGQVNPVWFDACEAARFTMFVSENLEAYPCSFMEGICAGVPLTATNMLDVWQRGEAFEANRAALREPACPGCTMQGVCFGGCPILPEINLCGEMV